MMDLMLVVCKQSCGWGHSKQIEFVAGQSRNRSAQLQTTEVDENRSITRALEARMTSVAILNPAEIRRAELIDVRGK